MTGIPAHDDVDDTKTPTNTWSRDMPGNVAPIADERVGLLAYLEQQRYVIKLTAYGLTDEEARLTPAASPLSVGGLIKHVAATERGWIGTVLQRDPGSGDDYETNFRLMPDETLADVIADYDAVARGNRSRDRCASPTSRSRCRYRKEFRGTPTMSTPGRCGGCCCI